MAFVQVQFSSRALATCVTVNVILPEADAADGKPPKVLYLLHGYGGDHSVWTRRTCVERYAAEAPLAIVMPSVNHSYYTNEAHGERYWDYVSEELPEVMCRFFRLSERPEDTFAAGLSMGGYGALRLGLTHPERFAAIGSFSGVVDIARFSPDNEAGRRNKERVFGDLSALEGSELDLFHLLREHAHDARRPRLYVSCGTADFLYDAHQNFVPAAQEAGWDVTHAETPDVGHEWRFWDEQIRRFIPWALGDTEK